MSNEDSTSEYQLKIKVINLIELAYKSDDKVTVSIVKSKGPFTLKVDQNGNATLSGKAGVVRFAASEEVNKFGIGFKYANIMFFGGNGKLNYSASFGFDRIGKITFTSFIDVEKLILSCSGLLCQAARLLKNRHKQIDESLLQ
jgi:hypothetical protein